MLLKKLTAYPYPYLSNKDDDGSVPKVAVGVGRESPLITGNGNCAYYWTQIKVDYISG